MLELANGTQVFVKAVSPDQNLESTQRAREEIRALEQLPAEIPAARLKWSHDDGTWVVLGVEAVPGRCPVHPWDRDELRRVLDLVSELARTGTPAPEGLPPLADALRDWVRRARTLVDQPDALALAVHAAGDDGPWLADHVTDLASWAEQAPALAVGDTLAHNDLRADNILLSTRDAWIVDWPHAAKDAPTWFDLAGLLTSVAMQGGGDPDRLFWSHPLAEGADRAAVRAALAALAGRLLHGSVQPPPRGLVNLRAFQRAQGVAALAWLRRF